MPPPCSLAVSYTHLDVYKRQRIGRKPQLIFFAAGYLVFFYPLMTTLGPSFGSILAVELFGLVLYAMYTSIAPAIMSEQFPTSVRAVGIGTPYNLVVALLGGTTPYLLTWLQSKGMERWFFYYVLAGAVITLITFIPVSYTHLDVYKRQGQTRCQMAWVCGWPCSSSKGGPWPSMRAAMWMPLTSWRRTGRSKKAVIAVCASQSVAFIGRAGRARDAPRLSSRDAGPSAVSYTHLDVYKRQPHDYAKYSRGYRKPATHAIAETACRTARRPAQPRRPADARAPVHLAQRGPR